MKEWTDQEVDTLIAHYGIVTNERLTELFPGRTLLAIYKKARKMGLKISDEIKFKNRSVAHSGEKCNFWNGGKGKTSEGYNTIFQPDHHRADKKGYVLEHIFVFERETGIVLPDGCCIHHLNGIKDDNRIENLCMMTHSAHTAMHHTGAKRTSETKRRISERMKKNAQ